MAPFKTNFRFVLKARPPFIWKFISSDWSCQMCTYFYGSKQPLIQTKFDGHWLIWTPQHLISSSCMQRSTTRDTATEEAHQQTFSFFFPATCKRPRDCSISKVDLTVLMQALQGAHLTKANQRTPVAGFMIFCRRRGRALTHPAIASQFNVAWSLPRLLTRLPFPSSLLEAG